MPDTTDPQQADRRERYAAAIRETDGWVLDGGQHMIDAVMAVADAERAALMQAHVALAAQAGRDQAAVARVRRLHDGLDAETDLTSPDDEITRGVAARKIAAALDGYTAPAAVLPEPSDRAAILREAADHLDTRAASVANVSDNPAIFVAKARIHDAAVWREAAAELSRMADGAQQPSSTAPLTANLPLVKGRCPACNGASLFLGDGGYVTCSRIDCPEPDAASTALEQPAVGAQQAECAASISGRCLAEAQSETACDTEAGECVHGGRTTDGAQQPETEPCGAWGGCTLARGHNIGQADIPENHRPSAVGAQQPETQADDARLRAELAQAIEHRDYWHQEAMSETARIVELEPAAVSQPGKARQADTAGEQQ